MNKTFTDLHNQALTMGEHIEQIGGAYEALERERDELRLELITRAGELQSMAEEKDELVRERDALAAYSKRLEKAFAPFMAKKQIAVDGFVLVPQDTYNVWILALNEVPEQSLNHITEQHGCSEQALNELKAQIAERQCSELAAQVEEETIERCAKIASETYEGADYSEPTPINFYGKSSASAMKNMPRKYAKQAGSTVEEGE